MLKKDSEYKKDDKAFNFSLIASILAVIILTLANLIIDITNNFTTINNIKISLLILIILSIIGLLQFAGINIRGK